MSWCGSLIEEHKLREKNVISSNFLVKSCPKLCGNSAFLQNFNNGKLGEITVFYVMSEKITMVKYKQIMTFCYLIQVQITQLKMLRRFFFNGTLLVQKNTVFTANSLVTPLWNCFVGSDFPLAFVVLLASITNSYCFSIIITRFLS